MFGTIGFTKLLAAFFLSVLLIFIVHNLLPSTLVEEKQGIVVRIYNDHVRTGSVGYKSGSSQTIKFKRVVLRMEDGTREELFASGRRYQIGEHVGLCFYEKSLIFPEENIIPCDESS